MVRNLHVALVPATGDYNLLDFHEWVQSMVDSSNFNTDAEAGIFKVILSRGTKGLSEKQAWVVDQVEKRYHNRVCGLGGEQLSLVDALNCEMTGSDLCDYHRHAQEKFVAED